MSLKNELLHKNFSHIYVEEAVLEMPDTKQILGKFPNSQIITIKHYKDVFNRSRQNVSIQSKSRSLILASNNGQRLFKGAPVCQDFGYDNFMYTASVQGCIFNCDYCFLKGMYSTGHVVVFVNFDDYKQDVLEECSKRPLYLCASYDTDLHALSGIVDYADRWANLAKSSSNLVVELRTKAAKVDFVPHSNVIYAFSVSPEEIIERFEHGTASFDRRLANINEAISCGCQVRLCFDPMVYIPNWENIYSTMVDKVIESVDLGRVKDISIGTVRISADYIKRFRRISPDSAAVQFPFDKENGYCVYPKELNNRMTGLVKDKLKEVFDEKRIYCE